MDDNVLRERVRAILENRYLTTTEKVDKAIEAVNERRKERRRENIAVYRAEHPLL